MALGVGAFVLVLALAAAALLTGLLGGGPDIESLAVLPFENTTGDPDTEYLRDGVTEAIISTLAELPDILVISRSVAFQYKDRVVNPATVGAELGIDALVLGRITQRGNELTVSAELVRTADSAQVWGEQYTRPMADLLEVQEDIANEVAGALRLELSGEQEQTLASGATVDSEAYQEYFRGRHHWARRTVDGLRRSIDHFNAAIAIDPAYAAAHVGLADAYSMASMYEAVLPAEEYPRALAAAERALAIEPDLAEAHTSLGWIRTTFEWNVEEAQRELERAIELDPSYADGYHWAGVGNLVANRPDQSIPLLRLAVDLEPLSQLFNSSLGFALLADGRNQEATETLVRTLELDPTYALARGYLALAHVLAGRYDDGITEYQQIPGLEGRYSLGGLGYAYAAAGREAEAREVVARLERLATEQSVAPTEFAQVYAGLGDSGRAFEALERAYQARSGELVFVAVEPMFRSLRSDPRFEDLLGRMGLAVDRP